MHCRRRSFVSSGSLQLGDSSGVVLSAAQRRRRSVYFRGPGNTAAARCQTLPTPSAVQGSVFPEKGK